MSHGSCVCTIDGMGSTTGAEPLSAPPGVIRVADQISVFADAVPACSQKRQSAPLHGAGIVSTDAPVMRGAKLPSDAPGVPSTTSASAPCGIDATIIDAYARALVAPSSSA